jgi:hypothetical protein
MHTLFLACRWGGGNSAIGVSMSLQTRVREGMGSNSSMPLLNNSSTQTRLSYLQ